jgi:hypothetical protein
MLDPSIDLSAGKRLGSNPAKLWKLARLLKAFGYADLAAATVLTMQKAGAPLPGLKIEEALVLMVPANPFSATTYRDFMSVFEREPTRFYTNSWRELEVNSALQTGSELELNSALQTGSKSLLGKIKRGVGL